MKALLIAIALLVSVSATAAETNIRTGIYSNMRFIVEDLIGMEIFVLYTQKGYYALVQCSPAEPNVPELVPVQVKGRAISFKLTGKYSSDCGGSQFRGTIQRGVLSGSFVGSRTVIQLKRRPSHWQQ